jgi:hypothetical protein
VAGWCDACQRRTAPAREYRIERRSTSRRPRRWLVRRRHLHKTAALMSLILPGAGQAYKGRVAVGAVWLVVVAACYWAVGPPALLVHLMCVVTAGSAARVVRLPFLYDGVAWKK